MHRRKATIILNAAAGDGDGESLTARLRRVFEENGVDAVFRRLDGGADGREKAAELVREAIRAGHFAVVAGGGDGTVGSIAAALVDTETALGVLPLGTLNHFARDLKIPFDVEEAARTIATGRAARVDVADVNGRVFVNNSSIGLYPSLVRGREKGQRLGQSKWAAFFWAALAVLKRYPSVSIRLVSDDGRAVTRRTPLVFIGNNRYEMNGLKIGSRDRLDGGTMAVYVLHHDRPVTLLRMGIEAVLGRLRRGVGFDFLPAQNVRIEVRRKRLHVATDGEVSSLDPPLLYRIHPKALRVIVPSAGGEPAAP
jgi:diacylglycerol kinase family enzyme